MKTSLTQFLSSEEVQKLRILNTNMRKQFYELTKIAEIIFINNDSLTKLIELTGNNISLNESLKNEDDNYFMSQQKIEYMYYLIGNNKQIYVSTLPITKFNGQTVTMIPYVLKIDDFISHLMSNSNDLIIYTIQILHDDLVRVKAYDTTNSLETLSLEELPINPNK